MTPCWTGLGIVEIGFIKVLTFLSKSQNKLDHLFHQANFAYRTINANELYTLEVSIFRFLAYIPDDSPVLHSLDEEGNHRFLNAENYMERIELSRDEFWHLAQQHRLLR